MKQLLGLVKSLKAWVRQFFNILRLLPISIDIYMSPYARKCRVGAKYVFAALLSKVWVARVPTARSLVLAPKLLITLNLLSFGRPERGLIFQEVIRAPATA